MPHEIILKVTHAVFTRTDHSLQ